jgi:hypothetical protein
MRIDATENTVAAIELDMDDFLRTKKVRPLHEHKAAMSDVSSEACRLSGRSVQEIDHPIEGLRGVRQKLNTDRDRLQREMANHAEFSETVLQLTNIVFGEHGARQMRRRSGRRSSGRQATVFQLPMTAAGASYSSTSSLRLAALISATRPQSRPGEPAGICSRVDDAVHRRGIKTS